MDDQTPGAVKAPLEAPVRPRAWCAPAIGGDYLSRHPSLPNNGDQPMAWEPLYDGHALDAAVEQANARQNGAWRLMCEKLVAVERAWFAQVLSEWDRTEDVEELLRMRLAGPNVRANLDPTA